MIFNNLKILNTPALLRLATVNGSPSSYDSHHTALVARIAFMYLEAVKQAPGDDVCRSITELIGQEALTECGSMNGYQIAENILLTSPGAALLSELRQRWTEVHPQGTTYKFSKTAEDEYYEVSLQDWIETLVSVYMDIQ